MNIGELEVALSRESLSYDQRTIDAINAKTNVVFNECSQKLSEHFAAIKTPWEAYKLYVRTRRNRHDYSPTEKLIGRLFSMTDVIQRDTPLMNNGINVCTIDPASAIKTWMEDSAVRRMWIVGTTNEPAKSNKRVDTMMSGKLKHEPDYRSAFVVLDETRKNVTPKIRQLMMEKRLECDQIFSFVLEEGQTFEQVEELLKTIGSPPLIKSSDLTAEAENKPSLGETEVNVRHSKFMSNWSTTFTVNINDGGVYVQSAPGDNYRKKDCAIESIGHLNRLRTLGLTPEDGVYALNQRMLERVKDHKKWIHLEDYVASKLPKFIDAHKDALNLASHVSATDDFSLLMEFVRTKYTDEIVLKLGEDNTFTKYIKTLRAELETNTAYERTLYTEERVLKERYEAEAQKRRYEKYQQLKAEFE